MVRNMSRVLNFLLINKVGVLILMLIVGFLSQGESFSQWKVVTRDPFVASVKYSIHMDAQSLSKDRTLLFPVFDIYDNSVRGGYEPLKYGKAPELRHIYLGKIYFWKRVFKKPLLCTLDSTFLYQRLFIRNLREYTIYSLSGNNGCWYKKDFKVTYEGYQIPTMTNLSEWSILRKAGSVAKSFLENGQTENTIKEFLLVAKTTGEACRFAVANFRICDIHIKSVPYYHPFFDPITGENANDSITGNSFVSYRGIPSILSPFAFYSLYGHHSYDFYVSRDSEKANERELVIKIFKQILRDYPFYTEEGINRKAVRQRFINLCQQAIDDKSLEDSLRALIRDFHDPHLFISRDDRAEQRRIFPGPLRVYEINHNIVVAAIFDSSSITLLRAKKTTRHVPSAENHSMPPGQLSLGDRVILVNGESIEEELRALSDIQQGDSSLRRMIAVSSLFAEGERQKPDTVVVVNKAGDTTNFLIQYGRSFSVPRNFRPRQCNFRILEGDIAYLRINDFDLGAWIRFVNDIPQIKRAKGLIIDLRSNGGGDEISGMRILSAFISKPSVYSESFIPPNRDYRETLLIKPCKEFHLVIPVIILIDKKTACASECFAYDMRKYAGAILVGTSRTAGAYAPLTTIILPGGLKISCDCLFGELGPSGYDFENSGIAPDIWVWNRKVIDLAPYRDKVLETALRLLEPESQLKDTHPLRQSQGSVLH